MSEEKNTDIQQSSNSSSANSASKKSSLTRRVWKVAKWVLLSLLFLIILIPILLYIPFIQRFAIDKASEWLSEETGMEVSVGKFSLGFPLDLEMGDVLAVENGDTVLFAENLEASVQLLPLLSGKVVVDKVQLDNTHLHTKDLIASMRLDGHVGSLTVRADSIDLHVCVVLNRIFIFAQSLVPHGFTLADIQHIAEFASRYGTLNVGCRVTVNGRFAVSAIKSFKGRVAVLNFRHVCFTCETANFHCDIICVSRFFREDLKLTHGEAVRHIYSNFAPSLLFGFLVV